MEAALPTKTRRFASAAIRTPATEARRGASYERRSRIDRGVTWRVVYATCPAPGGTYEGVLDAPAELVQPRASGLRE